jgi:hypothetical protein
MFVRKLMMSFRHVSYLLSCRSSLDKTYRIHRTKLLNITHQEAHTYDKFVASQTTLSYMINGFPFSLSLSRFVAKRGDSQSDESSSGHNTNNDAESQSNWRVRDYAPETNTNNGIIRAPWHSRCSNQNANNNCTSNGFRSSKYNDTSLEWRKPTTENTEGTERRNPFNTSNRRKHRQAAGCKSGNWNRPTESTSLQTRKNSNGSNEGNQRYDDFLP